MKFNNHNSLLDQRAVDHLRNRLDHSASVNLPIYTEITDRLLERVDIIRIQPKTILNIGWLPQSAIDKLQKKYPDAIIHSKQTSDDIKNDSYDLVIAHFSLLYEPDPLVFLFRISQALHDEGLLLFASLGPDTLMELRHSFAHIDAHPHVHTFTDMHDIGDWMQQLHFSDPVMDREEIVLAYEQLALLFDDLKKIGARNVLQTRSRGLLSKNKWNSMLRQYGEHKKEDYFPVTLEILYGHGWKRKKDNEEFLSHEVCVPIDKIEITKRVRP